MDSSEIRNFQYAIQQYIDKSPLPLEVKRLAIKEIYEKIEVLANEEIYIQLKKKEEEENKDA